MGPVLKRLINTEVDERIRAIEIDGEIRSDDPELPWESEYPWDGNGNGKDFS